MFIKERMNSKFISAFSCFYIVAVQNIFASNIVVDTSFKNNTHLTQSQNNIDIINIATPNSAGISNNFYTDFNVEQKGAILNNILSKELLGNTQLAGFINSNPNLDSVNAKLILNQVTGSDISKLLGYLEIAGNKADILLANPNGITCANCGFINAGNVTLATSILSKEEIERLNSLKEYTNSTPIFLSIKHGDIVVEALDGRSINSLTLLAKAMSVKNSLQTQNLRVVLGANNISLSPAALLYEPIKIGENENALALDVAYLGSIVANKIFIVATDKGVGIKNSGLMASIDSKNGESGFILKADGKIEIAKPNIDSVNNPMLYSDSNINVDSNSSIENYSTIYARNDINLEADNIINKGHADIDKELVSTEKFNSQNAIINNFFTGNDRNTTYTYDIMKYKEYIRDDAYAPAMLLGKNINIEANTFTNDTGIIYASENFNNNSVNFNNINPQLREITEFKNGSKKEYVLHAKCSWWSWMSKDWFCEGGYVDSSFTRANEYALIDFSAPQVNLSDIESNAINYIKYAIDSNTNGFKSFSNDYLGFINSQGFRNHLLVANLDSIYKNDFSSVDAINHSKKDNDLNVLTIGINAKNINIDSKNVLNTSNMQSSKDMMVNADFIVNENGTLVSKEGLNLSADSFKQKGGKLDSKNIDIKAKDTHISGGVLQATNDVNIDSDNLKIDTTSTSRSYADSTNAFSETKHTTTNISGANINLKANNINLASTNLNAEGNINLASNNVTIDTAKDSSYSKMQSVSLDSKWYFRTATTTTTQESSEKNLASNFNAKNISINATNNLTAYNLNSNANTISMNANNDITLSNKADSHNTIIDTKTETIGISYNDGNNFYTVSIGKDTKNTNENNLANIHKNTSLNADTISMNSKNISIESSDLNAKDSIKLSSNNVDIKSLDNEYKNTTTTELSSNKLRIGVEKKAINDVLTNTVIKRPTKWGLNLIDTNSTKNLANKINLAKVDSIGTSLGFMHAESKNIAHLFDTSASSSNITSNNITINSLQNVNILGSNLSGENIALSGENVNIEAVKELDSTSKVSNEKALSVGFSVSSGKEVDDVGINIVGSYDNKDVKSSSNNTTHKDSNIKADSLIIQAKDSTNIVGSNINSKEANINTQSFTLANAENTSSSFDNAKNLTIGENFTYNGAYGIGVNAGYNQTNSNMESRDSLASSFNTNHFMLNASNNADIIGSNLNVDNANINTNNLNLLASNNIKHTDYNKFGISLGTSGFNVNRGLSNLDSNTYNNSTLNTNSLSLNIDNSLNLIGGNVESSPLNANIANDVYISSKQNTENKFETSMGVGISSSFIPNFSGAMAFGTYKNVNLQSGIKADNINMNVGDNIALSGAYIDGNSGNINANFVSHDNLSNNSSYFQISSNVFKSELPGIGLEFGTALSSVSNNVTLNANSNVMRVESINTQVENQTNIVPQNMATINKVLSTPNTFVKDNIKTNIDSIKSIANNPIDNLAQTISKSTEVELVKYGASEFSNIAKNSINSVIYKSVDNVLKPLDINIIETVSSEIIGKKN